MTNDEVMPRLKCSHGGLPLVPRGDVARALHTVTAALLKAAGLPHAPLSLTRRGRPDETSRRARGRPNPGQLDRTRILTCIREPPPDEAHPGDVLARDQAWGADLGWELQRKRTALWLCVHDRQRSTRARTHPWGRARLRGRHSATQWRTAVTTMSSRRAPGMNQGDEYDRTAARGLNPR